MIKLHDELHKINDSINDIRSVIEASDKHLHEQYKRHITLICNSEERIKNIEAQVDAMFLINKG